MENKKMITITEEEYKTLQMAQEISSVGYLDLKALSYWDNAIRQFEYDFSYQDEIENIGFDKIDTNVYFYVVIDKLFSHICNQIEETISEMFDMDSFEEEKEIQEKLEKLKDSFSPFTNCLDSFFNNIFDELDLSLDKEELIKNAIELLNKTKLEDLY